MRTVFVNTRPYSVRVWTLRAPAHMLMLNIYRPAFILILACAVVGASAEEQTQGNATSIAKGPRVVLSKASTVFLSGRVDSNSPAVWDDSSGRGVLRIFTSFAGLPSLAVGADVQRLSIPQTVVLRGFEGGGFWLEAVVPDVDGTLYGYFHNEQPAVACGDSARVVPRIVAARSSDGGLSWDGLGAVIEAPPGTLDCGTTNQYFVGGVGDLSVLLDPDSRDLYIFYSEYLRLVSSQGVSVARLLWADRDQPAGKVMIWKSGVWQPARRFRAMQSDGSSVSRYLYPSATPLFPTSDSWHDDNTSTDAFWGPSVHWNTYLQQYVMLLNRAKNSRFDQDGIYVSFAPTMDDPEAWTTPEKILSGGSWYPQVVGLEAGLGTDRVAGEKARLFVSGRSDYIIQFAR